MSILILLIAAFISLIINKKFNQTKLSTLNNFVLVILTSLSLYYLLLRKESIFYLILISLLVLGLSYLIKLIKSKLEVVSKKRSLSIIIFTLASFLFFGTIWCLSTYNGAKLDQILITLFSPVNGTDPKIIISGLKKFIFPFVTSIYLYLVIFDKKYQYQNFSLRRLEVVLNTLLLVFSFSFFSLSFDLKTLIISYTVPSNYIEENYVDPSTTTLKFPSTKRNLIHIYLESVENTYFDKANGGNMEINLMPNLLEFSKNGYSFSNKDVDEGRGGPLTTYGATWSVASMVNQAFGVPMKVPAKRNAYGKQGEFFPGAIGIGDILKEEGYNQTLMFGADSDFGGLSYMFSDHGNFKIMDYKYAQDNNMLPSKDYNVNWGYEDEKLYQFAKEELTRLASLDKPFHFVMENADTHFPGFAFNGEEPIYEKRNKKNKEVDYAKTISFSDKHVVEFLKWITEQDFYQDTTVIIIGDHLSMDKNFFKQYDFSDYNRTTYNLILNPYPSLDLSEERLYNREYGSFDMMPTILASIGVEIEGDHLGLGTNLFSSEETLYEKDGFNYVNDEFKRKSTFYNKNLLS